MSHRVGMDQLEEKAMTKSNAPPGANATPGQKPSGQDQSQQNGSKGQSGQGAQVPPDTRDEVPPGDPDREVATHSKSETEFIEIATPTSRPILQIEDHFPLDPWPDLFLVDEIKVSLVYKRPFSSGNVQSILIKDITDISVEGNPLWAAVKITGGDHKGVPGGAGAQQTNKGPLMMKFLNKKQAAGARRLIFGLMIMHDRKVDTSKMSIKELRERAEDLGRARKDFDEGDEDGGGSGGSA